MKTLIRFATAFLALCSLTLKAQETEQYEQPPINYSKTDPHDAVTRLKAKIAAGTFKCGGSDKEIVRSLLSELHVPIESQIVVFSKTSLQRTRIEPDHPRALYYTDNCYIGWVPGGLAEVVTIDPSLGPIFYSFDPRAISQQHAKPEFTRDNDCLRCHGGTFVQGIPAVFARSVYADDSGELLLRHGSEVVDYRTPFEERWGGWYVTGKHGAALHRGNVFASEKGDDLVFDPKQGANITNLAKFFDTARYLTNSSDIVSLMVFEHQTAMQNAITKAAFNCRRMLNYQRGLQHDLKEPITEEPTYDSVKSVFDHSAQDVVDALLFKDEAALPDGIEGSPAFQKTFTANAPRAKDGSSLKDFLLSGHLFKNRCSYLIYSESFSNLPSALKQRVYALLGKALTGTDSNYAYIGADERARINTILRDTHPELRTYLAASK